MGGRVSDYFGTVLSELYEAHAENTRLRAELAEQYTRHAVVVMSRDKAEAAIARVREICRESLGSPSTTVRAWSRDVLRALDGK